MKTLILETSSEKGCLILADRGKEIAFRPLPGGPELSKTLALSVQALLAETGFQPEAVAAGCGPGSYTGIRVGAALAQALSFGWGVPLAGFCSLEAFAPLAPSYAVLIDARMGGLYALFSSEPKPFLIAPSDPRINNQPLFSPHPEAISRRTSLPCFEAAIDPSRLAARIHENPQPFALSYLSDPSAKLLCP